MSKLNTSRVRELICSYGANPMRWPETERQAGRAWLEGNPAVAQKLLAGALVLDQALDTAHAPTGDTVLLQARILRVAKNTVQDNTGHQLAANDTTPTVLSTWKTAAAVLVLTAGMGFGIGQAAADTSYASAEALLSMSMQSGYVEADLYGDEL